MLRKRTLSKVNRHSLHRAREEDEENDEMIAEPPAFYLNPKKVFMLSSCLCLAEDNRKIYVDTSYLNSYFNTTKIVLQNLLENRTVDINLQVSQNNPNAPLDYTIERLESYGNLELAMWAKRMKKYTSGYQKVMTDYYKLARSDDPAIIESMRSSQIEARFACEEIERQYAYKKLQAFSTLEGTEMLLSSFSEGFLEEMGYSVEEFIERVKEKGLPELFNKECGVHLDIAKKFLDGTTLSSGPIQDWSEYITTIYDKNGHKKEVKFHFLNIIEPRPEGILTTGYFILNTNGKLGNLAFLPKTTRMGSADKIIYTEESNENKHLKQIKCQQGCI